jgi:hypothetical protein
MKQNSALFVSVVSLFLILGLNLVFPPYVTGKSQETSDFHWTSGHGLLDDNSTVRLFTFADLFDIDILARETKHDYPLGQFNLTLRRPFEIFENWTKIYLRLEFCTGTYGGTTYKWNLRWRFYNTTTAFSDSYANMVMVSYGYAITQWKDNYVYTISRQDANSSMYNPAKWTFEANLYHNATRFLNAPEYQVYYYLLLEATEETATTKSNATLTNSFYLSLAAACMMVLVITLQFIEKQKQRSQMSKTLPPNPK